MLLVCIEGPLCIGRDWAWMEPLPLGRRVRKGKRGAMGSLGMSSSATHRRLQASVSLFPSETRTRGAGQ